MLLPYRRQVGKRTDMSTPRSPLTVEIFKSVKHPQPMHPWYIRLKAKNGQVLATSEGYFSLYNAKRAAKRRRTT